MHNSARTSTANEEDVNKHARFLTSTVVVVPLFVCQRHTKSLVAPEIIGLFSRCALFHPNAPVRLHAWIRIGICDNIMLATAARNRGVPTGKIVLSVSELGKNKQACIVLKNEFFVQRSSSHQQRS